jgi:mycobactin lysine-N-oxygenase
VTRSYDYVVDARGAQDLWMLQLLDGAARQALQEALGGPATRERLQMSVEWSLSVGGLRPLLYVPSLAGLRQGPGFPNLSCLGLLSDRVCSSLVAQFDSPRRALQEMP